MRRCVYGMERAASSIRLRHKGPLQLAPGVVWKDDGGWRYACPLGCANAAGQLFATAAAARTAALAHWDEQRERELAEIARLAG